MGLWISSVRHSNNVQYDAEQVLTLVTISDAFLDMAVPFIAAYKAGASDPAPYITEDKM